MITTFVLDESDAAARASELRSALREVPPGSIVAARCGNTPRAIAARDAAADHLFAPLNPRLAPVELAELLDDVRPHALITDDEVAILGDTGRRYPAGTLLFTSGTSGRPKGCVRTTAQDLARVDELTSSYGLSADDVHLIACPLAHSAPGIFLRACRRAGARTVVQSGFEARAFLAAVAQHRVTVCFLVPTQWQRLLALPDDERAGADWSSLRCAIVAGAPITADVKARILDWIGPRLYEFYGSSETGTITTIGPEDHLAHAGSVGRAAPGVEVSLRDGEIFVRSPAVMAGYLTGGVMSPAASEISVGDLGELDAGGWLTLVDRKHDTIISGGVNVYPAAVERALAAHPAVAGAVAFGVDDPDWGQRVAAVIALRGPVDDLLSFLRAHLSGPALPRLVAYCTLDELPLGSSGKPLRRAARAAFTHLLRPI